jgi:hypothetical protein
MALQEFNGCISLPASGDLSTKQYHAVKINSSGQVAVAALGENAVGILFDKPEAAGQICAVRVLDGSKAKALAGGTIAAGDLLKSDANGKLVTAQKAYTNTSDAGAAQDALVGSYVLGQALESAVANDIFQFLAFPLGAVPTTSA